MRLISLLTIVTAFALPISLSPAFATICTSEGFATYDVDADGYWDPDEYDAWASANQFTPLFFDTVDADDDGLISFEEWIVAYCST